MNFRIAKKWLRVIAATVCLGAGAWAQAGVYPDFTGAFDPGNWNTSNPGGSGTVYFVGNIQLFIVGPAIAPAPPSSLDVASWPVVQNLTDPVMIHFTWTATIGDGAGSADYFYVLNGTPVTLASLNVNDSPSSSTVDLGLAPGDTLEFGMSTINPVTGKPATQFEISQFSYDPVPEASTWIAAGLLVAFCGVGWHRARVRPGSLSL